MSGERRRAVLADHIRHSVASICLFCGIHAINAAVFVLYRLDPEPLLYTVALTGTAGVIAFVTGYIRALRAARERDRYLSGLPARWHELPEAHNLSEADMLRMLTVIGSELETVSTRSVEERKDMEDYYTAWVHQVKTPIAVMRMQCGESDSEESQVISAELFRIEQYVDMVLQYIRLGSLTNDLVIREYPLDDLIRESIRKFAPQFIRRKLVIRYAGTDRLIVTDRKWFACMLDQLLSNAVKYTPEGSVTICVCDDGTLRITDTGIGIASEDLPRIFEKGFTGANGRIGRHSSGLGLYLCREAGKKLTIDVSAESTPGKGTAFILRLPKGE